jgi:hypothetical protein
VAARDVLGDGELMGNFLDRLVARSRGTDRIVKPHLTPVFAADLRTTMAAAQFAGNVRGDRASIFDQTEYATEERSPGEQASSRIRTNNLSPLVRSTARPKIKVTVPGEEEPGLGTEAVSAFSGNDETVEALSLQSVRGVGNTCQRAAGPGNKKMQNQGNEDATSVNKAAIAEDGLMLREVLETRDQDAEDEHRSRMASEQEFATHERPAQAAIKPVASEFQQRADSGMAPVLSPILPDFAHRQLEQEKTVEITIGRLEVRMNSFEARPERKTKTAQPRPGLGDYLQRRSRRP